MTFEDPRPHPDDPRHGEDAKYFKDDYRDSTGDFYNYFETRKDIPDDADIYLVTQSYESERGYEDHVAVFRLTEDELKMWLERSELDRNYMYRGHDGKLHELGFSLYEGVPWSVAAFRGVPVHCVADVTAEIDAHHEEKRATEERRKAEEKAERERKRQEKKRAEYEKLKKEFGG